MFQPRYPQSLSNEFIEKSVIQTKISPLNRYFFYTILALAFACRGKQGTEVPAKEITITGESPYQYRITGNLLIVRANWTEVADTMELEFDGGIPGDLKVTDVSDSLQFSTLVLEVSFTGSSDMEYNEFYEYRGDSLKLLFSICDLVKIARKDANTLTGFTKERDEVVYNFQDDYPVVVNLQNDSVNYHRPDKQYIGYDCQTLDTIRAWYYNNHGDTVRITLKKGIDVKVDSIYRPSKTVRLLIMDGLPVFSEIDELRDKIPTNTAG